MSRWGGSAGTAAAAGGTHDELMQVCVYVCTRATARGKDCLRTHVDERGQLALVAFFPSHGFFRLILLFASERAAGFPRMVEA